jgi:small multidrug resistance pump
MALSLVRAGILGNLTSMPWLLLSIAIVAEIAGTLFLKASDGLSRLWPSIGVGIGYVIAFTLMAISLKKIDVGITYAIWSGVGIMGAAIGGVLFFDQNLSKLNIIGMAIIILGVVIMNLGGASH